MTSAINRFTELEIVAQWDKWPAVPDQSQSDLQHPLAHPFVVVQELAGRSIIERRIGNRVLALSVRVADEQRQAVDLGSASDL